MATEKTDVLVIGGGLLGTSTAYQLAKEKVRVTVLEQNAVGTGTSFHGSGRIGIPDHYVNPPELGRLIWTGSKIQMEPGDILVAEDLEGHGHIARSLGDTPRASLAVPLADPS